MEATIKHPIVFINSVEDFEKTLREFTALVQAIANAKQLEFFYGVLDEIDIKFLECEVTNKMVWVKQRGNYKTLLTAKFEY